MSESPCDKWTNIHVNSKSKLFRCAGFVLSFLLVASKTARLDAQVCEPCVAPCDIVEATVNAACVRRGIEPGGIPGECYKEGRSAKNSCMANCFLCNPSIARPDYLLVSILYAPPGNASSTSFGESSSVGVGYGYGTNFGSSDTLTTQTSFGPSFDGGGGFKVSVNDSSQTSQSTANSVMNTITTTSGTATNLKSSSDLIDHGQDQFLIWVNPQITVAQLAPRQVQTTLSTVPGQPMMVIPVTAYQLKNGIPPEKLGPQNPCQPGAVCTPTPGLSVLTAADITQILKQDPFLASDPTAAPAPSRYAFIESRPLENTSVAGGLTTAFTESDASANIQTMSQTVGSSYSIVTGATFSTPIFSFGGTDNQTWTWSATTTQTTTRNVTQQASVTLSSTTPGCCGVSQDVTCYVGIYEDMVYHTFAFVPERQTCKTAAMAANINAPAAQSLPLLSGVVTNSGQPAAGEKVVITDTAGQFISQIYTDHAGRFFSSRVPAGTVLVNVGSRTFTTHVSLGHKNHLTMELPKKN